MLRTILLVLALASAGLAADRPNILWITAEDMSPVLGCYGDDFAITPHIDKLASESVVYERAYASAPVCSPSRSCLINGLPATSQGTMQMRSAFPIPGAMSGFPSLLRKAGYYTSNNVKTDYNSGNFADIITASWDESSNTAHWRNKNGDKPFFSVFNLMTSHQSRSMVWPYAKFQAEVQSKLSKDEIHDPAKVPLPPYYVDTPVVRKTVARFYDCVTAMDKEVGAILAQLEEDGLAEDTIVFFYSDHGSGMPRHKRALLDSGLHVPLMIRVPPKYAEFAPGKAGTRTDRLVSFPDFAPSVLSLLSIDIPSYMEGKPFLAPNAVPPRDYVYGHRDRVDEVIDLARSVHDKRYLYIRNYMPHLGYNQPTAWPDLGEIRHEFYRLTGPLMSPAQQHFAGPTRPVEELYDSIKDPQNLNNLADSPEHRAVLERLRQANAANIASTRDLGFIPEALAWDRSKGSTPYDYARSGYDQAALVAAASQVGTADEAAFLANLANGDPGVRYWGAVGLSAANRLSEKAVAALWKAARTDSTANVRIEAANALARKDHRGAVAILAKALEDENMSAILHAARSTELLGYRAYDALSAMKACDARMKVIRPPGTSPVVVQPELDMAMFIGFSTESFITRFDGFKSLFDGSDLDLAAWDARAEGEVRAVDGEIHILSKQNLWLVHEKEFKNFELEVEALMPSEGGYNSGIGFRCVGDKKPKGYQCELADAKSGMIYAIGKGWVFPEAKEDQAQYPKTHAKTFNKGQWNHFRVRAEGPRIQIWVNGIQTADIENDWFAAGHVALQHHGKGGVHRFRNVRIRELP
jgi:N-sulfoglucosamine sulfohydrolase